MTFLNGPIKKVGIIPGIYGPGITRDMVLNQPDLSQSDSRSPLEGLGKDENGHLYYQF